MTYSEKINDLQIIEEITGTVPADTEFDLKQMFKEWEQEIELNTFPEEAKNENI